MNRKAVHFKVSTKDASISNNFDSENVIKTADTSSNCPELNQKINFIINFLLASSSEESPRKAGLKSLRSNADQSSSSTRVDDDCVITCVP